MLHSGNTNALLGLVYVKLLSEIFASVDFCKTFTEICYSLESMLDILMSVDGREQILKRFTHHIISSSISSFF